MRNNQLVLEATDGNREVLVVHVMSNVVEVAVEVPVVRVVGIVLGRNPEVGVVAGTAEATIALAVAHRKNRKAVGISTVATVVPAASGFQLCTRGTGSAHSCPQGVPLGVIGQVPALGAYAPNGAAGGAGFAITAALARHRELGGTVHGGSPGVQATVLGAGVSLVVVAITFGSSLVVFVVQVLRHPGLGADGHRLVGLTIAIVDKSICRRIVDA